MDNARNTDPPTSHEGGEDGGGRQYYRIALLLCYALAAREGRGLTDEEAMNMAGFDLADDGHRRRCSDLRKGKLIEQVVFMGEPSVRLSERTGKHRMVCTITMAGVEELESRNLL